MIMSNVIGWCLELKSLKDLEEGNPFNCKIQSVKGKLNNNNNS